MVLSEELVISNVKVPKGFITDKASIPSIFWVIFEDYKNQIDTCGIMHDYLYHIKAGYNYSNKKLYRSLLEYGVPKNKAILIYLAVQLFGWCSYFKRD